MKQRNQSAESHFNWNLHLRHPPPTTPTSKHNKNSEQHVYRFMSLLNFCFSFDYTFYSSIINTRNRTLEIISCIINDCLIKKILKRKSYEYTNRERKTTTTVKLQRSARSVPFDVNFYWFIIYRCDMFVHRSLAFLSLWFGFLFQAQPRSCQCLSFFSLFLHFRQNIDSSNLQFEMCVFVFFPGLKYRYFCIEQIWNRRW